MRQNQALHFVQAVPERGFRWVEIDKPPLVVEGTTYVLSADLAGRWLAPDWPDDGRRPVRAVRPLGGERAFARELAAIEPDEPSVASFAAEWGHLGVGQIVPVGAGRHEHIERLADWTQAILELRQVVEVWDAVRAGDAEQLAEWIDMQPEPQTDEATGTLRPVYHAPEAWHPVQTIDVTGAAAQYLETNSVVRAGLLVVQKLVNEKLREHGSMMLLFAPEADALKLHYRPSNLIGAAWLQLAQEEIDGRKGIRKCEVCPNWFYLSPDRRRRQSMYCSPSCKQRAYLNRRERAVRMHEQGAKPGKIAKELGTTAQQVRSWLGRAKGTR